MAENDRQQQFDAWRSRLLRSAEDSLEVVMTASKKDGQSCMRLERLPKALVDYSKVHHVGGGPYKGILINKEASAIAEDDSAEARLEFMAFLTDQENDNEPIQDYWILKFWFQSGTDGINKKKTFTDYFQELMNPKDFPKNYIGFVKRALVLLKKYSKIRRVDLVVQKSDEPPPEDEVLTVHVALKGVEIPPLQNGTDNSNMDFSKAARKRRAKLSLLWLAKRQRLLYVLEDAYPNSVPVTKLLENCKIKMGDMISAVIMLKDLEKRGLIQELDKGLWMRMPRGPKDTAEDIQMVEEMPQLSGRQQPEIAIVTALYVEKLAVDAMIEDKKTFVRYKTEGESQVYTLGRIGKYNVVSTKLSRLGTAQDAMISAENTMTRLLGTFNKVEHVFLVGVAGAVPHFSDFKQHVRLGDVVVSTPLDKSQSLYVECTKVEKMQGVEGYSYLTRAYQCVDPTLHRAVQRMKTIYESGGVDRKFEAYLEEAKDRLNSEESSFHRPPLKTDKLFMTKPGGDKIQLEHPRPVGALSRTYREGQPQVRYGVIGAGRMVARSEQMRREFAEMNEIKAFDAGYDAILESLEGNRNDSFLVIRGIADYADGTNKDWQPYASLVAASYMKAIIYALD